VARRFVYGERAEPPAALRGLYEQPAAERDDIGICCSGGGIRSAAFNLGALQALQHRRPDGHGTLQDAKYVSAVSGGSYIAAAFCMVAKTWSPAEHLPGTGPLEGADGEDDSDPLLVTDDAPPFHPGSPEEQYLRNHLGYLAPDGLARVHLGLRMLAGLLVNVLLIGLPVFIVGLLVGWWARADYGRMEISPVTCPKGGQPCDFAAQIPAPLWIAILAVTGLSLALAVLGVLWRPRRDCRRQAIETWEVRLLLVAAAAAVLMIAVPWLAAWALDHTNPQKPSVDAEGAKPAGTALTSIVALFAAAISHVRGRIRDERKAVAAVTGRLGRHATQVREAIISAVVLLAGPALLIAIAMLGALMAVLTAPADAKHMVDLGFLGDASAGFLIWLAASIAALAVTWFVTDLTSLSLHPFYRRRLCTAFALRRVWTDDDGDVRPAPAVTDGQARGGAVVARERRYDKLVPMSRSGVEPGCCGVKQWPMLIVCAAANVSDPGATPPGRAVASFTFSPRAIGGPLTRAAATELYENELGRNRRRDVTLPAAVAMSGAALSPSMGKLTYRPMTFLLALANLRLGVWVLNPAHLNEGHERGTRGRRTSTLSPVSLNPISGKEPRDRVSLRHRPRASYLWRELFGHNRLDGKFLYVTDGGHYENLGLVELLRRGCRTIYCFDAGGGTSSSALVEAIALAHSELNVEIDMEPQARELAEDPATHRSRRCVARGRITYPPAEPDGTPVDGTLFYVRSVVAEDAPWDILAYQETDALFPHHSTLDQFFDDRKFEAYRALGHHAAERALGLPKLHGEDADMLVPAPVTMAAPLVPG
jgi:Patatin-like phospholipase